MCIGKFYTLNMAQLKFLSLNCHGFNKATLCYLQSVITDYEYKKLHSLQSLVRTNRRTKTANITKDDTTASHRSTMFYMLDILTNQTHRLKMLECRHQR